RCSGAPVRTEMRPPLDELRSRTAVWLAVKRYAASRRVWASQLDQRFDASERTSRSSSHPQAADARSAEAPKASASAEPPRRRARRVAKDSRATRARLEACK